GGAVTSATAVAMVPFSAHELAHQVGIAAAVARPPGRRPVGTLAAEAMLAIVVVEVRTAEACVERSLPHVVNRGRVVVGDRRPVDPVGRTEREIAAGVQRDALPRIETGAPLLGVRPTAAQIGELDHRSRAGMLPPDDDRGDALIAPVL